MHDFLKGNPSKAKIIAQLQKEREEHKLDDEQTAKLAFLALFDANVFKQIKTDKLDIIKEVISILFFVVSIPFILTAFRSSKTKRAKLVF
jgi:hypothetical protein